MRTTTKLVCLILLVGVAALAAGLCGCSVAWNTVEEGAIECHFGSSGKYELSENDGGELVEIPPAIGSWSPEGYPGFWLDLQITQGSDAATDAKTRAALDAVVNSPNSTATSDASGDSAETDTE